MSSPNTGSKARGRVLDQSLHIEATQPNDSSPSKTIPGGKNEKPPLPTILSLPDFERAFEASGNRQAWAFAHSASNDLLTLNANLSAWHRLWFRPRILRDVSTVRTRSRMLGCDVSMPIWICPMGVAKTAGPEGEAAFGVGAAASGIVHCMAGTTLSMTVEDVVASAPQGQWWFQMYVDQNREKTVEVLKRVERLKQIKAVLLTVDLPVVSKREEDERIKAEESLSTTKKGAGLAKAVGAFIDPSCNWNDLAWLRRNTKLPIVLKGIQSAEDAKLALKMGCNGIVVSNHGGRALDNAPATLLILLELRRDCPEVFSKMEVFVDGGVRRGSDVLKAIMLGAKGVGVGRPFQYSLAYGREGVEAAAAILQDELETAMRLCGVTDLDSVRGDISYLNTTELAQLLPPMRRRSGWLFWNRSSKL